LNGFGGARSVTPAVRRSRDPDDDKFLECATAGGADYIVSADADVRILREIEAVPIVAPLAFWGALSREAVS
jgi:predicted nucleic acid-binding protein